MLKVTPVLSFAEAIDLTVGQCFLHSKTKQPCKVVDFPYYPLITFINLETDVIGVVTQRKTANFRDDVDLYKDSAVQFCEIERQNDGALFDELCNEYETRLKDLQVKLDAAELRIADKNGELNLNNKLAKEILELAKAITGAK